MSGKWERECLDFVRSRGVENVRLERGGKLPRIVGVYKGRPFFCVMSSHGSGGCDRDNFRGDVRRNIRNIEAAAAAGAAGVKCARVDARGST